MTKNTTDMEQSSKKIRTSKVQSAKKLHTKKLSHEEKKQQKLKAQLEKLEEQKNVKPANVEKFYVTNDMLFAEMEKWRKSAKNPQDRRPSEALGKMILDIANKVLNRSEFRNYPVQLKEDCRSFFFYKVFRGLDKYDFNFKKPFSWITQIAFNAYLTVLKQHYRHVNLRSEITQNLLAQLDSFPGMSTTSGIGKCIRQYVGLAEPE